MSTVAAPAEAATDTRALFAQVAFNHLLGLQREFAEGGVARLSLDLRPELTNNFGVVHGGVLMSLMDSAMSSAALSASGFQKAVVTIDMSTSFHRPGRGRLLAHATKNVLTISHGSRSGLFGMGCKARCAVDSPAIDKRRNAADRPKRHLPEGLERNRAIGRPSCLHGHEPMRRIRATHSSRLRANAARARSSTRSSGGGRSVCFCEARVEDAGGQVVARAMGTFRYVRV